MLEDLKSYYSNARGFKSQRKIIVIESDDWGSVRMPSKKAYNNLLEAGISVDKCGYNTFDGLETTEDLDSIFNSLLQIKDYKGNSPVITANTIVANPDYDKIRSDHFQKYHFETFSESYNKYHGSSNILNLIQQGIDQKIYFPQLHGREHVYIDNWMQALRNRDVDTTIAFDNNVYGISTTISKIKRKSFLTALDVNNINEIDKHELIISEAQEIFKKHFGYTSTSFIAPNYTWHPKHELFLKKAGIETLQGGRAQKVPFDSLKYHTIKHYMGKVNELNQMYLVRNSSFEPSIRKNVNWQEKILNEVKIAFFVGAPVIISSHRVNFMGGLNSNNREENLKNLTGILKKLIKIYPEIEFMNSTELALHIRKSRK
jgi:hypothetical protein